ncbi:hypothetical protein, partial [Pseudoduganella lurida]|uniref:hypothetical protein n=1 Tax=Pseudoduganella lurida TaxID=1036180 RepID=UPI001A7E2C3D
FSISGFVFVRQTSEQSIVPADNTVLGLEGFRLQAEPRPAGCGRAPSAPPALWKALSSKGDSAFSFAGFHLRLCYRTHSRLAKTSDNERATFFYRTLLELP